MPQRGHVRVHDYQNYFQACLIQHLVLYYNKYRYIMRLSFEFTNVLGAVYHRGTIKFNPGGSSIFSPVGNKIVVYDLKANKSEALPLQVNYNIQRICIHPRNTIMLAASEKSHLYMVSLINGRLLHFKEYKTIKTITHISFSPDGRYYCVCGDNTVLIYVTPGSLIAGKGREIVPFRLLRKFRVNHDTIVDLAWSLDTRYICAASQDLTLNVFDLLEKDASVVYLRGHTDTIVGCIFANRSNQDRQLYSITRSCQLFIWDEKEEDNDEEEEKKDHSDNSHPAKRAKKTIKYYRSTKHYLKLPVESDDSKLEKVRKSSAHITACDYNSNARLLVVGYNAGYYCLYEMPDTNLIYNLDSNSGSIDTISINTTGDWIAFGSSVNPEFDVKSATNKTQSRLLVWEWQSKSHIFDQSGSGISMANLHECLSYSLDGTHVVSGNLAGKIKVWSSLTGETVATFGDEHKGPIKAIKFVPNKSGKVIISASLDGTIRAYDLNKFKNFRTFQSPVPEKAPEFICLDVDSTGEFIAAGTYNYFEIYLYSLQTSKFLEYLSGHEGPVSGLAFSPISNILVSTSWDCTIRIWNLFEGSKCIRDKITMAHEVVTVAFRPDGHQFAVSMSNGQIALFNPDSSDQLGAPIEGSGDLGTTQLIKEVSRDTKKYFSSLHYSADGSYLIAGGNSNFICIYHTNEKILIKKIAITFNMSMDGVFDYVSNRKRSEFGYNLELLEKREEEGSNKRIKLPGVLKGDLGERNAKPVMLVCQLVFSPTMRTFAAATTEGVLIYSLDVSRHFDPYRLAIDVDPASARQALEGRDYISAIVQSIQLNDKILLREVLEKVPSKEVDPIIASLQLDYVKLLLSFISNFLPDTPHIEFYLLWLKKLLYKHGVALKNLPSNEITPIIRNLHQNTHRYFADLKRNCDYSRYSLEFLTI